MRGAQQFPRYRDPIARNVARLLLRSLQEQHRAPSSTVIEFEARFGQLVGQVHTRRYEFPVATATAAILDSLHSSLYTFEAGVTRSIMNGVELALLERRFAGPNDFRDAYSRYASDDVLFLLESGRRLNCAFGPLTDMQRRARSISVPIGGSDASSSSSPLPSSPVELRNPFAVLYGAMVHTAIDKRRVAHFDMCCPSWCADLRFVVSAEVESPVEPQEVLETLPSAIRFRNRATVPVTPFFKVHLTQSLTRNDLWWHPSHNIEMFCCASDVARAGAGTVIPVPQVFKSSLTEPFRKHVIDSSKPVVGPVNVQEIEVEVNVKALLQAWKKNYGRAAASAYLSSAALVSTTVAGTSMDLYSPAPSPASPLNGTDSFTEAEVRACVLAEREDPFLLRVAEDYLALLQFLGQLRVYD